MERYTLAAIASGLLMGLAGPLSRILNSGGMSAEEIAVMRFGIAALILGLMMARRRTELRIRIRDLWIFLGGGVLGQFCFAFFYFRAVTLAPLAVVSTLSSTYPFFVLVFSCVFWKEKLTKTKAAALFLALLGSALVSGAFKESGISIDGIMMAAISGVAYALFCIFSRIAVGRGYSPKTVNFYTWVGAFLCALIVWPDLRPLSSAFAVWQNIVVCLLLGGVVGCGASYLFSWSLKVLPAGRAAILASSSPLVAMVSGAVLFDEQITIDRLLGVMILLLAIFLLNYKIK